MPAASEPTTADLIRQAIDEADTSIRQLARDIAGTDAAKRESVRRRLHKYVDEGVQPGPAKARELAEKLGKPADHFVRPITRQTKMAKRAADLEAENRRLRAELKRHRDGP